MAAQGVGFLREASLHPAPSHPASLPGIRFLSGTAGAIAITGVTLLPQQTIASDEPVSLEGMANALHEAVGRYSDRHAAFDFGKLTPNTLRSTSLDYAMERLRHSSVDEIQNLLKPLFGGAS